MILYTLRTTISSRAFSRNPRYASEKNCNNKKKREEERMDTICRVERRHSQMERESTPVISALKCRQRTSVPRVVETREDGRYPIRAHSPRSPPFLCLPPPRPSTLDGLLSVCTAICIIFTLPPKCQARQFHQFQIYAHECTRRLLRSQSRVVRYR